jgi:hypothetical protein
MITIMIHVLVHCRRHFSNKFLKNLPYPQVRLKPRYSLIGCFTGCTVQAFKFLKKHTYYVTYKKLRGVRVSLPSPLSFFVVVIFVVVFIIIVINPCCS